MTPAEPHYLLSSEANRNGSLGHWRFTLRAADESSHFEAADVEPDVWGERLDLLTVIRGLESLDQPSRVTLTGCSRYVEQGIQYGLAEWRENGWQWEAFGHMVSVKDADLWQRMDRLLEFHRVECGQRRMDGEHTLLNGPHWGSGEKIRDSSNRINHDKWVKCIAPLLLLSGSFWMHVAVWCWHHVSGCGPLGCLGSLTPIRH